MNPDGLMSGINGHNPENPDQKQWNYQPSKLHNVKLILTANCLELDISYFRIVSERKVVIISVMFHSLHAGVIFVFE